MESKITSSVSFKSLLNSLNVKNLLQKEGLKRISYKNNYNLLEREKNQANFYLIFKNYQQRSFIFLNGLVLNHESNPTYNHS